MMNPLSFPLFPGLSARDALSLSTDGPISARQWAEARAYDLAHPLQPGHAITRIGAISIKRSFGVKLLSRAIAQAITARGLVEERDLLNIGLSKKQVAEWTPAALAKVLGSHPGLTEFAFQEAA
jgi:hypothetical protein